MTIFLLRHASPDWSRTDIPYDIPPGPPLSAKGEQEAQALAEYLKSQNVAKLYYSPFERSAKTAAIISVVNRIPCIEDERLSEWREATEPEIHVIERISAMFDHVAKESTEIGSIGLVSHGGPIALLLQALGFDKDELAAYRKQFDRTNPLPPAGAWKAEQDSRTGSWNLQLEFTPKVS